ncbi:DgyrCDS1762 [Dimorphilus gyrociliatus]|nr:DgyrCDS1762 [Dimorphilus gyrociliatus]
MIWLIALSASSVQLFIGRAVTNGTNTKPICREDWEDEKSRQIYTFFVLLTTYVVPLTILTATYGMVGVKLWQRTTPGNADQARDMQQLRSKRKVIKMLVVIVALFAICWLPLHLFMIVLDSVPSWTKKTELQPILNGIYYTVHWLAMSNSCVNPIVYSFLNDSFRADLKRLVRNWCNCFKGRRDGEYARTLVRDYSRSDRASLKGCDTNRRLLSSRNQHEDGGELGQVVIALRNVGERQRDSDLNRL